MLRLLRHVGIADERVLAAMSRVRRDQFVRPQDRDRAYEDRALPIGEGQTISQPYVVARMTELLQVEPGLTVLEVGTGSGYQAAVLAELGAKVVSVERHRSLAETAGATLGRLGYDVAVVHADASVGYPPGAPFDRIIVTAASPRIDPALSAQLAPGGLVVAPVGTEDLQELVVAHADGRVERQGAVRFVPLRGEAGFRQ